ncbi:HTH-type transcriptional repressor YtrA [Anaerohalosphaera lusitana]|uniref:HTH-type transcriptional repressor YtrA n=1 Tax=Anaerohalosphaera lusitana TaxID=1936003 RepID=A0A1U9NHV5_9BACT|nr:GntR family transcriptional regulator [Anaerohalosphaera lusitana]AQT67509.1 HTH-type transcriptional repressor YtrA [Anaerohalosphaera lusitana]
MLLEIDHHSGVPIFRQIVGQVRRQIMVGGLAEGEQLAAVRDLAARLKVNPMTVSKAYSLLEVEGLVERRRGVGVFVARVRKDRLGKMKGELLDGVMDKAAVTAIQLGVSKEDAWDIFEKHYREYDGKSRRKK